MICIHFCVTAQTVFFPLPKALCSKDGKPKRASAWFSAALHKTSCSVFFQVHLAGRVIAGSQARAAKPPLGGPPTGLQRGHVPRARTAYPARRGPRARKGSRASRGPCSCGSTHASRPRAVTTATAWSGCPSN